MKNSTNRRLTQEGLLAIVYLSGSKELLGRQFLGDKNNEYNSNIFKAFKSLLKKSYGPVFPRSWQGRQLIAGGVV